jgi:uncharacterized protein with PhoU and TrkA domain
VRVQYRRITNVLAATVTDNTARVVGTLVGEWEFNPPPERQLLAGEVLIAIATPDGKQALQQTLAALAAA